MCVCIHPQPGILIGGLEAGQVTLIGCGMQPFMWALVTGLSLCMVACIYRPSQNGTPKDWVFLGSILFGSG